MHPRYCLIRPTNIRAIWLTQDTEDGLPYSYSCLPCSDTNVIVESLLGMLAFSTFVLYVHIFWYMKNSREIYVELFFTGYFLLLRKIVLCFYHNLWKMILVYGEKLLRGIR